MTSVRVFFGNKFHLMNMVSNTVVFSHAGPIVLL